VSTTYAILAEKTEVVPREDLQRLVDVLAHPAGLDLHPGDERFHRAHLAQRAEARGSGRPHLPVAGAEVIRGPAPCRSAGRAECRKTVECRDDDLDDAVAEERFESRARQPRT